MVKSLLFFAAVIFNGSLANAFANSHQDLYTTCQGKVTNMNYGSRGWEDACTQAFDMPGPYLIKCATWVKDKSFPTPADIKACQLFCQSQKNWGPWYDYEIQYDLKEIVQELKRRHDAGKCMEN